jgi:hypothetical protein
MGDMTNTLLLILGLGLVLVLLNGYLGSTLEGFDAPISCGVNNPCELGLKCINGFCYKAVSQSFGELINIY